ncbi:hypothetical protein [Jeongeupia chitinilytica]|uniref:DUF2946 domain-containing protein n=1 Tax=Jeongeupia chitinilytica TaxID=1041641 RepID=A0ABQ3GUR9_9NEIS|nr:hypothetical protein [Jeongeupia chitinilytica]GHD56079.1 hypothetical protein GCM10007350_02500 [Jeongeupia chitinilytica]
MFKFSVALRPRPGRWLLLALMCLLPWQSLYASAAPMHVTAMAHAEVAQNSDCHGTADKAAKADCDSVHCAACTPPIIHRQTMTLPTLVPVRVATALPTPLDIVPAPALKPPRR